MARSTEQRLADLEQHAWVCGQEHRDTRRQVDHLVAAAGEAIQLQRSHGEHIAVKGDERLARIESALADIAETLADHTVRFERVEAVLREHTARLERIEQAMVQQAGLLRTIVDRLGGQAPAAAEG